MDDEGETFENETPPADFDLTGETVRAQEAADGGITERIGDLGDEELDADAEVDEEGAADDGDDFVADPADGGIDSLGQW